ncbi:MAG: hypothetical protein ABIK09_10705 [Pseudomonadota bacterium]
MRVLPFLPLLALAACGGADKHLKTSKAAEIRGPAHLVLEGRALQEAACDRALDLLVATPEAMEGYSLAELRGECLEDLAEAPPEEARRRARCYLDAADIPQLAGCSDPELAAPSLPRDSPAAVVPHALTDPTEVDPLTWRVCVHLAEIAMAELANQIDAGQVAQVTDMAVNACVDALKTVPRRDLETVSDCLLEANTVDEMKGCNLPKDK